MSITRKRIYVDMDDTICDYTMAKLAAIAKDPSNTHPQSEHDFFRTLKPISMSLDALRFIKKQYKDVWILTRPNLLNPLSYTEKMLWVRDHLGQDWVDRLILCPDKSLLKGDLLIDDHPWPEFEGRQIQFGSAEYPDWLTVLDRLKETIKIT